MRWPNRRGLRVALRYRQESGMPLHNLTQDNRLLAVETSLGKNYFLLTRISGHEAVSQLFQFELEMLADNDAIQHTELIGQNITFSIAPQDGSRSYFNGFINQLTSGDQVPPIGRIYRIRIVPWLWFLTRTAN